MALHCIYIYILIDHKTASGKTLHQRSTRCGSGFVWFRVYNHMPQTAKHGMKTPRAIRIKPTPVVLDVQQAQQVLHGLSRGHGNNSERQVRWQNRRLKRTPHGKQLLMRAAILKCYYILCEFFCLVLYRGLSLCLYICKY